MRDRFLIAVVLAILTLGGSLALAASHATSVISPVTTPKDSRVFAPFLKQAIPDVTVNSGDAVNFNLKDYYAAGDDLVTGTAIAGCADIAPTFTAGGTILPGTALTQTDKNNATWGGTATGGTANNTYTIKVTNCSDAVTGFTDSIAWSVTGAGVSGTVIPEGGVNYFVCPTGSDTGAGNTQATRWASVGKVNGAFSSSTTTRPKVWFCAGATFTQALTIDWSGNSSDHVTIGTYYVSGGVAYQLTPDNPTAWPTDYTYNNGARAIFAGTCQVNTWQSASCKYDTLGNPQHQSPPYIDQGGAVPSNMYLGMITVAANYVDLQDVRVYGSSGVGVIVPRINYTSPGYNHVTMKRLSIQYTFTEGVKVEVGQFITLRDSVLRNGAVFDNPESPAANLDAMFWTNHHNTFANNYLVEGNDIANSGAEGFDIFFNPVSFIIRGNRIGSLDGGRPCIYGDDGTNIVIEYNICYGGTGTGGQQNTNRGMAFVFELGNASFAASQRVMTGLVIRGNMFAGTAKMVEFGDDRHELVAGKRTTDAKIYGNTGMGISGSPFSMGSLYTVGAAGIEIKNNIIETSGTPCLPPTTLTSGTITYGFNLWNALPAVSCRGTGDVTGTADLAGSSFSTKTSLSPPVPADFEMDAASPGENVGTPLTATILTAGDYLQSADITYPCATFDLKGNVIDATCSTHSASTPDMGALER